MPYLMIDIEGVELSEDDIRLLQHPGVAGVVFFKRNFECFAQLKKLTQEIRTSVKRPLLLAVDQEGGRVQRFEQEFTKLPAMGELSRFPLDNQSRLRLTQNLGWLMASEVIAAGIDISFAPVLDVDVGISQVIGKRSFGDNPRTVISYARSFVQGMQEAGMSATGKHFPGHGGVGEDSHTDSPVDHRSLDELRQSEMIVFEQLIHHGLCAVMPSHVIYPTIDSQPACFSSVWLTDILRGQLAFDGCIFSDDLSMQGAAAMGSASERARLALDAGVDILLCCNDRQAVNEILGSVDVVDCDRRQARLSSMMAKTAGFNELSELKQSSRYKEIRRQLENLS